MVSAEHSLPLKSLYEEQGYVVIPNHISNVEELRQVCDRIVDQTRAGGWPYRRTVGKQFPPWDDKDEDVWGVQHLMHPDLREKVDPEGKFVTYYTSMTITEAAKELLGCTEKDLQMELFNMLINPARKKFSLRWHRDDISEKATEAEEAEALGKWRYGVQWNTALYRDDCLYVVPGSHRMPRTPGQRALSETMDPPDDPTKMPGCKQVILQPGDTVFYNSNILHCATYDTANKRATLHGTYGNSKGGYLRARNILQHELQWMKEERFKKSLDERSRGMLDKLLEMQAANPNVGYSLES